MWVKIDPTVCPDRGIAIYPFKAKNNHHLQLILGDFVLLEKVFGDEWYYGRLETSKEAGIFPCSCIQPEERERNYPKIFQTLREWSAAMVDLYINGDDKCKFEDMCKTIEALVQEKINLDSGVRAEFQVTECKEYICRMIDQGNMELRLDLQLRNPDFTPRDPLKSFCASLYHKHKETSNAVDNRQMQGHSFSEMCSVAVELQNMLLSNNFLPDTEFIVSCSLYTVQDRMNYNCVSEVALINGTVADIESRKPRIVFTDLTRRTLESENITLVVQVVRKGPMDAKKGSYAEGVGAVKRPVAVGCVKELFKNKITDHPHCTMGLSAVASSAAMKWNEQFLESAVASMFRAESGSNEYSMKIGFRIVSMSYNAIREDPSYRDCIIARRLAITDDLKNSQKRNSIYIQLMSAEFSERWDIKQLSMNKEKNIEVDMMLMSSRGDPLEIFPGGANDPNAMPVTKYMSTVYYHKNNPRWGEMVKINIPDNPESDHIRFTFLHRSSNVNDKTKLIAMSYLPLKRAGGCMQRNGEHKLIVYKVTDHRKLNENASYINLPYSDDKQDLRDPMAHLPQYLSPSKERCTFSVFVTLCSTIRTNNEHVFRIMNWRDNVDELSADLVKLTDMLESNNVIEIFKFFSKIFDVFFGILCDDSNHNYVQLKEKVFHAILKIITHAQQSEREHFSLIVNRYLEAFQEERAHISLVKLMTNLIQRCGDKVGDRGASAKKIKDLLKCAEFLFKFIVRSKKHALIKNKLQHGCIFENNLNEFFDSIQHLMDQVGETLRVVQLETLKVFPKIINMLVGNCPASMLTERTIRVINAKASDLAGNYTMWKHQVMIGLTSGPVFDNDDFRRGILRTLVLEIEVVVSHCVEAVLGERSQHDRALEVLKGYNCTGALETLDNIVRHMEATAAAEGGSHAVMEDVGILVDRGMFRLVSQLTAVLEAVYPNHCSQEQAKMRSTAAVVVVSLLQLMHDSHWRRMIEGYVGDFVPLPDEIASRLALLDLEDFACELCDLITSLCNFNVFTLCARSGTTWSDLILLQSYVCMRTLQRLYRDVIKHFFYTPLNQHVLNRFFDAISAFVRQPCLQWDHFSVWKKERFIDQGFSMNSGCDMRREATNLMYSVWSDLESSRYSFVTERVEPLLEMSFVQEKHVRQVAISMIFDLMLAEEDYKRYNATGTISRSQLLCTKTIEAIVSSIDKFRKQLDQKYKDDFQMMMSARCQEHRRFQSETAQNYFDNFVEQMQLLIEYNSFKHDEHADNQRMAIFNLLEFYEKIQRGAMRSRYLHKLVHMNERSGDYTEAANTLLQMADQLLWSDDPLGPNLEFPMYGEFKTHAALREKLYNVIIEYFEKDRLWELALVQAEKLISYYRDKKVDFQQTSIMLEKMSHLYREIFSQERNDKEPSYFIIYFFGDGFPSFIANKSFIYRARFGKKLADIIEMLEIQFPMAQKIHKKRPDSTDRNQYFRVIPVKPVPQPPDNWANKEVNMNTMWFYLFNGTEVFEMRTPKGKGDDVTKMYVDVTTITTQVALPSYLRMVPVLTESCIEKNPLENAIDTTQEKTDRLRALINKTANQMTVGSIENIVQGIVMAHVAGGYLNYKPFFTDEMMESSSDLLNQLCACLQNQLDVVQRALVFLDHHTQNRGLFEQFKKSLLEKVDLVKQFGVQVNLLPELGLAILRPPKKDTKVYSKKGNGDTARTTLVSNTRNSQTESAGGSVFDSSSTITENPMDAAGDRNTVMIMREHGLHASDAPPPPPRPATFMSPSYNIENSPLVRRPSRPMTSSSNPPPFGYVNPTELPDPDDSPPALPPRQTSDGRPDTSV